MGGGVAPRSLGSRVSVLQLLPALRVGEEVFLPAVLLLRDDV
jgi:hypothetical protein